MKIGVLAVQGAFAEHLNVLRQIGADGVAVRLPEDLEGVSGLILPGGESTAIRKLVDRWGLREPIQELADRGAPVFGTCAGMILLSRDIVDGDEPVWPLLDVSVKRNAFGRREHGHPQAGGSLGAARADPGAGRSRRPRVRHVRRHDSFVARHR